MKKNKSTIGENVIPGIMLIFMIIGLFVVGKWGVDGAMKVFKTYNKVTKLSSEIYWLEQDVEKITNKLYAVEEKLKNNVSR